MFICHKLQIGIYCFLHAHTAQVSHCLHTHLNRCAVLFSQDQSFTQNQSSVDKNPKTRTGGRLSCYSSQVPSERIVL